MRGTYLGKLLDSVLAGDESAYKQFLHDRLNPQQQCDLMGMLSYLLEQAKLNENGLRLCYPEALVEVGSFLQQILNADDMHIKGQIKEFITLLFQAAFAGNVGAQTVLIVTVDGVKDTDFVSKLKNYVLPPNLDEFDQHQLTLAGTIAILRASRSQGHNTDKKLERSESKLHEIAVAQDYSIAINSLDLLSGLNEVSNGLVSREAYDLKAIDCFERAGALGNASALVVLGFMYERGRAGKALASQEERDLKAVECYEKASVLGNAVAIASLGSMYFHGRAGKALASQEERDLKAVECLEKASALGNIVSLANLGSMYLHRRAGKALASQEERDLKAVECFEKAAALGNAVALVNLGKMYLLGKAGRTLASQDERDLKAIACLEKARALGILDAHYMLGFLYLNKRRGKELSTKERLEKANEHFLHMCLDKDGVRKHFLAINEQLMQSLLPPVPAIPSAPPLLVKQNASAIKLRDTYKSQQHRIATLELQAARLNSLLYAKEQVIQMQVEKIHILNEQLSDALRQQMPAHMQQLSAVSSQGQQKQIYSSAGSSAFFSSAAVDTAALATDPMDTESMDAIQSASSSADNFNSDTGKREYDGVPNNAKRTKNDYLAR